MLKRDATKNKPLLVNFWATWCDPCREEFPDLVNIEKQYRPHGLDFTAVSLDDFAEIKTSVPQFLREMQVTVPTYLLNVSDPDIGHEQVDPAWSGALPATFLYDSQGKLVYKRLGRIKAAGTDSRDRKAAQRVTGIAVASQFRVSSSGLRCAGFPMTCVLNNSECQKFELKSALSDL